MATVTVSEPLPRYDVEVHAGRAFQLDVPVLDGGIAVPATGVTGARVQVRPSVDSPEVMFTFGTEEDPANAVITGSSAAGVRLVATSAETDEWQQLWPGTDGRAVMWWDLEITDSDGARHQLTAPGTFTLIHQVTR